MTLRVRIDPATVTEKTIGRDAAVALFRVACAAARNEADFQAAVVKFGRALKWMVHHERPARTKDGWRTPVQGDEGFPDTVFARGPGYSYRVVVAELKYGKNKPTQGQYRWLGAFEGAVRAFWWTPEDVDQIVEVLCGD